MANSVFANLGTTIFEAMSRLAAETGAVNLGQGFPEGLEPQEVIEAAARAMREGPHQYPSMMGMPALRQAVAANTRRHLGLDVDWEREVMVTSGATEALADAFFGLLDTGDEVILLEPAYDSYAPIIRRGGAVPVAVRLAPPDWSLPLDQLAAAVTPRTRAIVINTPMNPIGKVFSGEELRALADFVLAHDLVGDRRRGLRAPGVRRPPPRDAVRAAGDARAGGAHRLGRQDLLGHRLEGRLRHGGRQAAWRRSPAPTSTSPSPPRRRCRRRWRSASACPTAISKVCAPTSPAAATSRSPGLRGAGFEVADVAGTYFAVARWATSTPSMTISPSAAASPMRPG